MNADQIFKKEYGNNRNVMTSAVICREMVGDNRAVELSTGSGFSGNELFGVTVVDYCPATYRTIAKHALSKCLHSEQEAKDYIEELKERKDIK